MNTVDISTLSRDELSAILSGLKRYRRMQRSLGRRARSVFERELSGTVRIRGEFAPGAVCPEIIAIARAYAPDLLTDAVCDRMEWTENPALEGGVRIFVGDDMIDLSYRRARALLLA